MNKKNVKKRLIICIIIVVLVILGISVNLILKNKKTKYLSNDTIDRNQALSLYYNYNLQHGMYFLNNKLYELTDETKAAIAYYNARKIPSTFGEDSTLKDLDRAIVSYDDLNASYKKLFGEDANLSKDIQFATRYINFKYNDADDSYYGTERKYDSNEWGYYYLDDYGAENGNIYITVEYVKVVKCASVVNKNDWLNICGDIVFKDNELSTSYAIVHNDIVYPLNYNQAYTSGPKLDEYKKASSEKFKLTFKEQNGNYILIESESIPINNVKLPNNKHIIGTKISDYGNNIYAIDNVSTGSGEIYGYAILNNNIIVELRKNENYIVADYTNNCGVDKCEIASNIQIVGNKMYYLVKKISGDKASGVVFSYDINSKKIEIVLNTNDYVSFISEIKYAYFNEYSIFVLDDEIYFGSMDISFKYYRYNILENAISIISYNEFSNAKNKVVNELISKNSVHSNANINYYINGANIIEKIFEEAYDHESFCTTKEIIYNGEKICDASTNEICKLMYSTDKNNIYFMKKNNVYSANKFEKYYKYNISNGEVSEIENISNIYNLDDTYLYPQYIIENGNR